MRLWLVVVLAVEYQMSERTLGDIGELVLAHGLECCALHLALELWWDAEEKDGEADDSNDAGDGSKEGCGGHREICGCDDVSLWSCGGIQEKCSRRRNEFIV